MLSGFVCEFSGVESHAEPSVIMVAYCQNCRQHRCVGCLTGFLGCRCRGYEQSSGNSTLVSVQYTFCVLLNFELILF